MSDSKTDKLDFDPYKLLELNEDCTEADIKSAYRKKALQWHPDKNPDRRDYANDIFLKVTRASEILLDAAARGALDRLRKAKQEVERRTSQLDSKRRKLKEELEAREQAGLSEREAQISAEEKLATEIERLRRQGSDLLKTMREEVERQVHKESPMDKAQTSTASDSSLNNYRTLKISWDDSDYDKESLEKRFGQYGDIIGVVVGKKTKKGQSALVEFEKFDGALSAWHAETDTSSSDMNVKWMVTPPENVINEKLKEMASTRDSAPPPRPAAARNQMTLSQERDLESAVLTKMRQAQERRQLAEEMRKRDADEIDLTN